MGKGKGGEGRGEGGERDKGDGKGREGREGGKGREGADGTGGILAPPLLKTCRRHCVVDKKLRTVNGDDYFSALKLIACVKGVVDSMSCDAI
jgi:hypothetical protein